MRVIHQKGTAIRRNLSVVLLRLTLFLALVLGVGTALVQLWLDIHEQKDAVEQAAGAFLDSVTPSAASAVYNYHNDAAQQVVAGLFAQPAIRSVTVWNDGAVMVQEERVLEPTLPAIGPISHAEEVTLRRVLYNPDSTAPDRIGEITVVVDRSIVPPAVVRRLVSYFVLATVKNLLFGLALVALIYTALARHIVQIAETAGQWRPGSGAVTPPRPPRFLSGTEVELLGQRIREMSGSAETAIETLERSRQMVRMRNTQLNQRSNVLSEAVKSRTEELKTANIELKRQADRDAMTGLLNRGAFDRLSQRALDQARNDGAPIAVLMVDVDYFKPFNDHYGHQAGDTCLKRVADALNALADDTTIVARYGGEEFICLIGGGGDAEATALASNIHRAFETLAIPHERSSVSDKVTASIGLSWEPATPATSLETLLNAADEALYEAKHSGRNRTVQSSAAIRDRVRKRRDVVSQLLRAVEQREFEPFFQSQHNALTGRIVGMEALARWRHPSGQVMSPADFMRDAEDNDLVRLIDAMIFEKCETFLKDAQAAGARVPGLSLNLSEQHLSDDGLTARLAALRAATEAPLSLELLESTALDEASSRLSWTIDSIRDMGFDIEIDDFGTGKTSILSLMHLNPNRLKIARELVMEADQDQLKQRMLGSVVDIGRNMGIGLVAEGVENEAQKQILLDLGCKTHQGFLYARPISAADQIAALLRDALDDRRRSAG